ncbi:hypothetical protein [Actinomadura atramentaria]|uniref:hypothetical protein n=1 Tax=Actinomadura atramentaria TaxID=1990 RepID=UPI00036A5434|nr:hypothetical protein [Actinomadura atramentaria]
MTAVITVGAVEPTGIVPDSAALRLPDDADAFLAGAERALDEHGAAVVVHPAWHADAAVRLVRRARALLDTDRVAAVGVDLPPLAFSVVADQLAFVAPHVPPGALACLPGVLAARVVAGARVRSVARLEHVRTGLRQHVASYLPGSAFVVLAGAEPGVHRVTAARPVPEPPRRPLEPVLLLASADGPDAAWADERLAPALRAASVTSVPAQPLADAYWGVRGHAEFAAFSGHPDDLSRALAVLRCAPCPWCGAEVAGPRCPFCGMARPAAAEPATAETPSSPPRNGAP